MAALEIGARLVAGLLLILANGFFVAVEFALTRVRQYPEEEFDAPGLRRAWEMTERLEIHLTACQVGITASSIAVGIVAEPALVALFEPAFAGLGLGSTVGAVALASFSAFFLINLLHLTHGEQTPTYLGVERTKAVVRYGARPLDWFTKLIWPLIYAGDRVAKWTLRLFGVEISRSWTDVEADAVESRAELRNEIQNLLGQSDVSGERREEVVNALAIGETPVEEVMVPREEVVALSTADSFEENLERMEENPHVRFPLVGDDLEDIEGIVYAPELLRHTGELEDGLSLEEVAADPMTVSAGVTVADLIDQFQVHDQELAVVLSNGEAVGVVTATDAFEAITGELEDPLDREHET